MRTTSEYCAVGHPDRTCDYISSYILDRYMERDPKTRYAVEVQMKDNFVTLGGEVTSKARFTKAERAEFVRQAVREVGYTAEYAKTWGEDNVPNADALKVTEHLSEQSPDIAQGVDADGWGDQGIFWGMAVRSPKTGNMPLDHYIARRIGERLVEERMGGIDVKTQVETTDGRVSSVIVAVPCFKRDLSYLMEDIPPLVKGVVGKNVPSLIVNGTGAYIRHGSMGDCGTTGRKLVVDFYGGNCRIGGGAVFGKDPSKSDVALNCYARYLARKYMEEHGNQATRYCSIAGCIGKPEIRVVIYDEHNKQLDTWTESKRPDEIIDLMKLREPKWFSRCWYGLFGNSNDSI